MDKKNYQMISVSKLELNNGQLEGLPKNPRFIKDERYQALLKSISDSPEFLDAKTLKVYPMDNGKYVVIGGNMRLRACKELGFKELPCFVFPKETPIEKLKEFIIKDNLQFGSNDWDILGNEFEVDELLDWGLECDFLKTTGEGDIDAFFEEADLSKEDTPKDIVISVHIPSDKEEMEEEVREAVKLAIEAFEGVKIK